MTVTLRLDNIKRFQQALPAAVGKAIAASVQELQDRAQAGSRVDTGAQSISVGAVSTPTVGINDYDARVSAASELRPDVVMLPPPSVPEGPNILAAAAVQCAVPYGKVNNDGGAGRSGDGWFTKAQEEQRDKFPARVAQAVQQAGR